MKLDICILMSLSCKMMDSWVEKLKNTIDVIVKNVTNANQGVEIRFGSVVILSDNQPPDNIQPLEFTDLLEEFKEFMFDMQMKNEGFDDDGESENYSTGSEPDIVGGLETVLQMDW